LYRVKPFGENTIYRGLGLILDNLAVFNGGEEFRVIIVITGCDVDEKKQKFYKNELAKYRFIERIIFRSNEGKDIGSYNCGFKFLKNNGYEGDVLFMNSSVSGPNRNDWLLEYKNLFHSQAGIGLYGIAMNNLNR
jgi:ribosomal protein S6E (S10)